MSYASETTSSINVAHDAANIMEIHGTTFKEWFSLSKTLKYLCVQQNEYGGPHLQQTLNVPAQDSVTLFEEHVVLEKPENAFYVEQTVRITHRGQEFHKSVSLSDFRKGDINVHVIRYASTDELL